MTEDSVKLAEIYHMLSPVRVAVLRDLGRVRVEGGWETYQRGDEAGIPYWMATFLEKRGDVEVREPKLTDTDIGKYLMIERRMKGSSFHSLKERFYLEARELIRRLREEGRENPENVMKAVKVEGNLSDIVRIRLRKILNAAFLSTKIDEIVEKLLPEERGLLLELSAVIQKWFDGVTKVDQQY